MSVTPMNAHLARIRPDRFTLLLIAIAIVGTGLVLARQINYGPSLHSDSVQHISAARGLLAGEGLINAAGSPYEWWPPLFPMLLAAGSLGVFDPLDVAGPLNAMCFGLTVLVVAHWMRRHLRSRLLVVWGGLALTLSIPVAWIASWVMSEMPFILFTTLALSFISAFLREPKRSTLLWAAVFTALAWLTRYIGIAVVGTIILMLLLQHNTPITKKARRVIGYGLISSIPVALFIIRNYIIVGDLTTSRQDISYSLLEILEQGAFFLGGWAGLYKPGADIDETIRIITAIVLLLSIAIIGFWLHRNEKDRKRWYYVYPYLLFIPVIYILTIVSLFRGEPTHGLQERYIIPTYTMIIPVLLTMIDGVIHDRKVIHQRWKKAGIITIYLVIFGWTGYGIHISQEIVRQINSPEHRFGYQAAMYADSDLLEFVDQLPSMEKITGNFHTETIYFHANRLHNYSVSPTSYTEILDLVTNLDEWYLIYSYDPDVHNEYSVTDLLSMKNIDIIASFNDGVVFQIFSYPERIWETYDNIVSEFPVIRSDFSIYVDEITLLYTAEVCESSRISPRFYLHITPQDTQDLHSSRQQYGFDNIDFAFMEGPRYDPNRCMRSVLLPDYPIVNIRTGQYDETGELWSVDIPFSVPGGD